jgi:superfamily II helicase
MEYRNKIAQIAADYHDREISTSCYRHNDEECPCCKRPQRVFTVVEHNSRDFSKDLLICSDCYADVVKWWLENEPNKIPLNRQ